MAKKWVIRIPYEGTAYIPIENDEKPIMFGPEVTRNLHMDFLDEGMPVFYRMKGEVEEASDRFYQDVLNRVKKRYNRKGSIMKNVSKTAKNILSAYQKVSK
jgi:hypothetical protein